MAAWIAWLERMAAAFGCAADNGYEFILVVVYRGIAARYAEYLSDCARSFFGV